MHKLLVILGPTATGKTDLALSLAKIFNGELITCDSRQVYKGLDIGTGKSPGNLDNSKSKYPKIQKSDGFWVIDGVKVWMYDVENPRNQYSVYDFVNQTNKLIRENWDREKLPILVGGTGLYLKGLLQGFDNMKTPIDADLREKLEILPVGKLQEKLSNLSPIEFEKMNRSDRNNPRRLIRKIEHVSMYPYININILNPGLKSDFDTLKIGLTAPRSVLYSRIDSRLDLRIDQGLITEGQNLLKSGVTFERMRQLGLEYGVLADFLEGKLTRGEFNQKLKNKIHQYAKRQLTWFKKEPNVGWFDITEPELSHRVEMIVENWYNDGNND